MKTLPQKSRIPEEVIYNKKQKHNLLQLHQGSVVQHPRNGEYKTVEKYMAYRPKPDALREEMPLAKLPNPNHILPSQVKKMQTYLTHPPAKTIRSIGFTSSAPSSPTLGRKNIWPPTNSQIKQLPRTGFNPNVMYNEGERFKLFRPSEVQNSLPGWKFYSRFFFFIFLNSNSCLQTRANTSGRLQMQTNLAL